MLNDAPNTQQLAHRYASAQTLLQGLSVQKVVYNEVVFPLWVDAQAFWYVQESSTARMYLWVDVIAHTQEPAFDHQKLADSLSEKVGEKVDPQRLPLQHVCIQGEPRIISFSAFERCWCFHVDTGLCEPQSQTSPQDITSPDGRYQAFSRDHNLWLRDLNSGEERALTNDGEAQYCYAAVSRAWGMPNAQDVPQVIWSGDSKRLLTVQRDSRSIKRLPVTRHVPDEGVRPVVEHVPLAYPGDEGIETHRVLSIEVATGHQQAVDYEPLPATRNGNGFAEANLGWWGKDARLAYFVHVDRYFKFARVLEFNTDTGACRTLFEETTDTHINLMLNQDAYPAYLPLPETDELLWFSERTGCGQFYLYDLMTGQLKRPITQGPGLARHIVKYLPESREAFFACSAQEPGRDPYYRSLVRVHLDTGETRTLASGDHNCLVMADSWSDFYKLLCEMTPSHCPPQACGVSPTGDYAVVTETRADRGSKTYVINREGQKVMDVANTDLSSLPEGWQWPEPVTLKAADGQTDIYGLVYRPSHFDPERRYPIVSHGFNQPEIAWVPKGAFFSGTCAGIPYLDAAALAELGFIVLQLDGRGSPEREKSFFDHCYGEFARASDIDDHVAAIRQLAERHSYIDQQRVGITAHTTGGSGAVQGLLKHPDFFKVGVQHMYHDGRLMPGQMQGDKYEGVAPSDQAYAEDEAHRLQGKLLLTQGMLDTTCPPAATFRLIDALKEANKDFDLILLPKLGHGSSSYLTRRSWDYLVRHLIEVEPPAGFKLTAPVFGAD